MGNSLVVKCVLRSATAGEALRAGVADLLIESEKNVMATMNVFLATTKHTPSRRHAWLWSRAGQDGHYCVMEEVPMRILVVEDNRDIPPIR